VANGFGLENPGYYDIAGKPDPLKGYLPPVGQGV
jgi:hypothetical protein